MKTFPDFMRYMIPITPILIYFAVKGLSQLGGTLTKKVHMAANNKGFYRRIVLSLLVAGMGYSAWETMHLVYYINKDTRQEVVRWLSLRDKAVRNEAYTNLKKDVSSVATRQSIPKEKSNGVEYLIVSSLMYDRFDFASRLKHAPEGIKNINRIYQILFKQPYFEIKPAYKTFAFSNPTIRIIDIRWMNEQDLLELK